MKVTLNNNSLNIQDSNLEVLINTQLDQTFGIAVAVNSSIVPKNNWASTTLTENDEILIITATQGG